MRGLPPPNFEKIKSINTGFATEIDHLKETTMETKNAEIITVGEEYTRRDASGTGADVIASLLGEVGVAQKSRYYVGCDEEEIFAAVVGYTTAKQHRIKLGDKIRFGHNGGTRDDDLHEAFTVVGILDHTGSPNDRAVFVNLEGFYQQHEGDEGPLKVDYSLLEAEKDARLGGAEDAPVEETEADEDETPHERRLTAVLIVTKEQDAQVAATMSQIDQMMENQPGVSIDETQLISKHQRRKVVNTAVTALQPKLEGELLEAQAVAPVQEIAAFYQDVIGNIQYILILFAVQVIIVAGIGMMVSIYNSMNERRQEIAIMRALGARRVTVMSIILLESILLSLGGGILGVLIGHSLVWGLSPLIMEYSNVMVRFWDFQPAELILIPGLVAMASVVGYLPAVIAYRTDVAQSLQP